MNLTENGIMMFYNNLEEAKSQCLNEMKAGSRNDEKQDKYNQQAITIMTNLQVNLLKLKKIMKLKQEN
jgi:hypothetical protein